MNKKFVISRKYIIAFFIVIVLLCLLLIMQTHDNKLIGEWEMRVNVIGLDTDEKHNAILIINEDKTAELILPNIGDFEKKYDLKYEMEKNTIKFIYQKDSETIEKICTYEIKDNTLYITSDGKKSEFKR